MSPGVGGAGGRYGLPWRGGSVRGKGDSGACGLAFLAAATSTDDGAFFLDVGVVAAVLVTVGGGEGESRPLVFVDALAVGTGDEMDRDEWRLSKDAGAPMLMDPVRDGTGPSGT